MSLKPNARKFDLLPEDTHHAICVAVYDVGTHMESYENNPPKPKQKLWITWELPEVRCKIQRDGQEVDMPRVYSQEYTNSRHVKASFMIDLVSWKAIAPNDSPRKLLGKNCLLGIVHVKKRDHNGNVIATYQNKSAILPLTNKYEVLQPENPLVLYEIESGENFPDGMPEFIREKARKSLEFQGKHQADDNQLPCDDKGDYDGSEPTPDDDGPADIPWE